jgi:uncharacterized phage protein (TIGR02218 family)
VRTITPALQAHFDSGATTLCHCWKLTKASAETLGFTDHDRTLSFDGVAFEESAGFNASEIESFLGFAVDNLEAEGALSSSRLDEAKLLAGEFDNAAFEVWLVNWQDVSQRLLLRKGNLGEVTRGEHAFTAELRGLAHALSQPKGRIYQFGCDAAVGDQRCGVDLDLAAFRHDAAVASPQENRRFIADGASAFAENWFARGTVEFVTGNNAGKRGEIKFHRKLTSGAQIELWQPMPQAMAAGDQVILRAGCDKQFSTCKTKFSNTANFRGFPHVPGDDFVLTYVSRTDSGNDGGSRN